MTNDPKDRHVVAAAVHCDADIIVTSNLRDFPSAALLHYDITAFHPDAFLLRLYRHSVSEVELRLCDQAKTIGRTLPELLRTLKIGVPRFDSEVGSGLRNRLMTSVVVVPPERRGGGD